MAALAPCWQEVVLARGGGGGWEMIPLSHTSVGFLEPKSTRPLRILYNIKILLLLLLNSKVFQYSSCNISVTQAVLW